MGSAASAHMAFGFIRDRRTFRRLILRSMSFRASSTSIHSACPGGALGDATSSTVGCVLGLGTDALVGRSVPGPASVSDPDVSVDTARFSFTAFVCVSSEMGDGVF